MALDPPAAGDIIALVKLRQQRQDVGGVVLQVSVHRHDHVASGKLKASRKGSRLTKIAAQVNHPKARIVRQQRFERDRRAINTAIVDKNYFTTSIKLVERRLKL